MIEFDNKVLEAKRAIEAVADLIADNQEAREYFNNECMIIDDSIDIAVAEYLLECYKEL